MQLNDETSLKLLDQPGPLRSFCIKNAEPGRKAKLPSSSYIAEHLKIVSSIWNSPFITVTETDKTTAFFAGLLGCQKWAAVFGVNTAFLDYVFVRLKPQLKQQGLENVFEMSKRLHKANAVTAVSLCDSSSEAAFVTSRLASNSSGERVSL